VDGDTAPDAAGRPEVWRAAVHVPGAAVALARAAERDGFDGLSFGDTQHLAADPFVGLALAATATERLGLMVGVTNPVTRHPAVTAAAIASVQLVSGGRAVLGVGRGDSSLAHLGRPPAPVEATEHFVAQVQAYLRGEAPGEPGHPSPLGWLGTTGQPKVPLDVAATGPRMLAAGAALAERVTVNVGADPARVAWAVAAVRRAAPPGAVPSLGAYLVVAAHPDPAVARELARGPVGAYAHFPGMPGGGGAPLDEADRRVVVAVARDYDLTGHGRREGRHVAHLTDDFVDRYAVVGTPEACAERLAALAALGLDRFLLVEGADARRPDEQQEAHHHLVREVLPVLRPWSSTGGPADRWTGATEARGRRAARDAGPRAPGAG